MSKILIETYRGFDIEFDTNCEKFQCVCTEESAKESTSFTAVKKFVDEYLKANSDFKPFFIQKIPGMYGEIENKKIKIVGIRKDNRFIIEDYTGEKKQHSDYDLSNYMLFNSDNEISINKFIEQQNKEKLQSKENQEARKQIISSLNILTLKDYKYQITK